jgi:hypothetical protein
MIDILTKKASFKEEQPSVSVEIYYSECHTWTGAYLFGKPPSLTPPCDRYEVISLSKVLSIWE